MTGFGFSCLLSCLIIFILAANYNNNLLLFVALSLFTLLINSAWFSWLNIRRLSLNTLKFDAIYAEQTATMDVLINNPNGKHIIGCYLEQAQLNSRQPITACNELSSGNNENVLRANLIVGPLLRGCYPIGSLSLVCRYPFDFFRWQKVEPSDAKLWVYPAAKGKQVLPKPKANQGTYLKREQGDFSHVRQYQRGDSLNHIAWKQMARTGDVMTKEFDGGEGLRQTWLDYNDINLGDPETRLSQLCRWILDCHQRQLKYGLKLPSLTIEAAQGEAHKENCLQALAKFAQS